MNYDDEEMPQPPTELPPDWKPGDMLPPEQGGDVASGGLLARSGLPEPGVALSEEEDSDPSEESDEDEPLPNSGRGKSGTKTKKTVTEPDHAARVVYGETSGLYPQGIDPNRSPYDESNWDPKSRDDLQEARRWISAVQERNSNVQSAHPHGSNPIEQRQWQSSKDAASSMGADIPPEVNQLYMIQKGVGPQLAPWDNVVLHKTFGPFRNVGGGQVPRGDGAYIQFYKPDRKRK